MIKNPYCFIDKHNHEDERKKVIKRLFYLTKTRGKGYRNSQAKYLGTKRER